MEMRTLRRLAWIGCAAALTGLVAEGMEASGTARPARVHVPIAERLMPAQAPEVVATADIHVPVVVNGSWELLFTPR